MGEHLLFGQRVLVVEDEMLVLMAIEDMLTDLGCTSITAAGSLENALDLAATRSFDLATLDVNLNGERSYPVADALSDQGVPFAFVTGYGEHGVEQGHGNRVVLSKPYSCAQFTKVMAGLIAAGDRPTHAA